MQGVKEKAIQLLKDQTVDRVIGWRAGEFFYDLTPGCFTSAEEVEKEFVYSVFSGANLSKYLIAESRKGGKVGVFLKPCDSYSFVQLLKEHRILRENVYAVGVQCDGMCDTEAIKALGAAGVTAVTEDGEDLKLATIYGDETVRKADAEQSGKLRKQKLFHCVPPRSYTTDGSQSSLRKSMSGGRESKSAPA